MQSVLSSEKLLESARSLGWLSTKGSKMNQAMHQSDGNFNLNVLLANLTQVLVSSGF
jgi:hypothetical protein